MKYLTIKGLLRRWLPAAVICCGTLGVHAQATAKPAAPAVAPAAAVKPPAVVSGAVIIIDAFFKKYKEDGTGPAIDYIFGTNKLFTDTVQIAVLKGKLDGLRQSVGDYIGRELIVQRSASASLVFYSYLVKHEKSPIRFTFMFYKPHSDWELYRFKYDDQLDAELDDAGKINNRRQ